MNKRLAMELATVEQLLARSSRASLRHVSHDARVYQIVFDVRTLVRGAGHTVREEKRAVRVIYDLAPEHPATRPIVVACDPKLFNPHVSDPAEPLSLPLPYVCLGDFHPSLRLADWIIATYRVLAWQRLAADHPLNHRAAAWARREMASGRFPIDPRPFFEAADAPVSGGEAAGDPLPPRSLRLRLAGGAR
jgi:sulfur relay (sulfurtransferase) DsrC/TusE family protein